MSEPTYRQHKILEMISESPLSGIGRDGEEEDMDNLWELAREGYLKGLASLGTYEWVFKITEKGEEYLKTCKKGEDDGS